jgi:hypothetical protein
MRELRRVNEKLGVTVCLHFGASASLSAPGSHMVERAATAADLGIKAHAHMLRHAVPRTPQYPEYDALHGFGAGAVQGVF